MISNCLGEKTLQYKNKHSQEIIEYAKYISNLYNNLFNKFRNAILSTNPKVFIYIYMFLMKIGCYRWSYSYDE